jgi:hypothetical protein
MVLACRGNSTELPMVASTALMVCDLVGKVAKIGKRCCVRADSVPIGAMAPYCTGKLQRKNQGEVPLGDVVNSAQTFHVCRRPVQMEQAIRQM